MTAALEIDGLEKTYVAGLWRKTSHRALSPLRLSVPAGEVFGYIGPNGSGKTTTLKILMGLVMADGGDARVLGLSYRGAAWRYRSGYLPEQPYFYDYLTAREYLEYAGRLLGMDAVRRRERAEQLLVELGLMEAAGNPLRRYSKGMQQRLGIAQALINDPELVFLDEPMSGLDPIGRRLVREMIQRLRGRGRTVFFSTHILPDAESLCDRIGLLRRGRLLHVGRLDEILNVDVDLMEMLVSGAEAALSASLPDGVLSAHPLGERWRLEVDERRLGLVIRHIEEAGGRVLSVQPRRLSLEEYFVKEMAGSEESR